MDTLSKDTLVLLAMELNYADIIKFCSTSKKINRYICQNNDFWRNRLYKEYPFSSSLKLDLTQDFRKLYQEIEKRIEHVTKVVPDDKNSVAYGTPSFIHKEFADFLLQADIGVIGGTNIPINYILYPTLKKRILTPNIAIGLLNRYLRKYIIERRFFRVGEDMNRYLDVYLSKVDIDRNKFMVNRVPAIAGRLFIPRKDLTPEQFQELSAAPLHNLQLEINKR